MDSSTDTDTSPAAKKQRKAQIEEALLEYECNNVTEKAQNTMLRSNTQSTSFRRIIIDVPSVNFAEAFAKYSKNDADNQSKETQVEMKAQNNTVTQIPVLPDGSLSSQSKITRKLFDVNGTEIEISSYLTPTIPKPVPSREDNNLSLSSLAEHKIKIVVEDPLVKLQHTIRKIKYKPGHYIGISKSTDHLVKTLCKMTKISEEHFLMCLQKIRRDTKFSELAREFRMPVADASNIFFKTIPIIASVLRPLIEKLNKETMNTELPPLFRRSNIYCVIDYLEIEIQKPTKPVNQMLTWSKTKNCHTMKYLISITPHGLVHYISPAYGGGITDISLIKNCDFINDIEEGACVLTDKEFKYLGPLLQAKGCQLVRPSKVRKIKMGLSDIRHAKRVATMLKIKERLKKRLGEFTLIKSQGQINPNLVCVMEDVIVIASSLINIQDSLFKTKY